MTMTNPNPPCNDPITREPCPDRCAEPNCHTTCEKYIAFEKKCKELRHERFVAMNNNRIQRDIKERRIAMAQSGRFYKRKKEGR